ncbi:hypothetical protein CLOM_g20005 [Closterium sp. NIES-68]|nr:hypothetical protein CLOM_g20005 [Closterium sp. NIES-68]GJP61912.1 hypothetical protein CLOP_g19028 [Closterium sp. NIES-67]GJP77262.1 hypothetical protein CLOP_g7684 [Closterium sp. NIES-67]
MAGLPEDVAASSSFIPPKAPIPAEMNSSGSSSSKNAETEADSMTKPLVSRRDDDEDNDEETGGLNRGNSGHSGSSGFSGRSGMAKFSEESGESGGRLGASSHLNLDASASVFNESERPIREPIWVGAFIICAAVFILREFTWFIRPLLSLRSFALHFFSLESLAALAIAMASIFPTMFVFLVFVRRMSVKLVKWCLRIAVAFFIIHSLMALHTRHPPPDSPPSPAVADAPPQPTQTSFSGISGTLPASTSAASSSGQSAASILQSAAPFSMSRFLLATSAAEGSHIHAVTAKAAGHLAAYLSRRKLQEATVATPAENPNPPVPQGGDPNANSVLGLEMFLTDLLNGLAVLAVLLVCRDYHPLSATVIGRASQAVMTRARGLIVGVAIFSFLCIILFVPVIASLVELFFTCRFLAQQDPQFGSPESPFHPQEERCLLWSDSISVQHWLSPLAVIFLFIGIWMAYQIGVTLQFIAAATVAQVYSNMQSTESDPSNSNSNSNSSSNSSGGSLQEEAGGWFDRDALVDRWNIVARAVKLAYSSSMGTICLVSFILTLATVASVLLNVLVISLLGMTTIVVVPRVAIAFALFIFTYFFTWLVVVVAAISGHGSRRSLALSVSLLRNHLKSALAVNLTAKCILGVISTVATFVLFIFFSILMLPLFGHLLKSDTIQAIFVFLPVALAVLITVFSFKLVFVPVVATMFVCFAWDNRIEMDSATGGVAGGAAAPLSMTRLGGESEELTATVVNRASG